MCQRWAANAIKIKASRLHCPLRQHWRPGGNGKETLSRPRWLPFFSFYSIHTPSVRLFHQHKMQKKKNVLRPASRCGYLSSGSQVNEPIKISNFFFYEKYRLCVSKIRLTSLADRKRREAAVPCGFVADVEHAHTKTSRSHTHTQTLRLENIDLQSFVSTNEHYASFFKVHNQPATWLLFKHHQSAAAFLLAKLFFFFESTAVSCAPTRRSVYSRKRVNCMWWL